MHLDPVAKGENPSVVGRAENASGEATIVRWQVGPKAIVWELARAAKGDEFAWNNLDMIIEQLHKQSHAHGDRQESK